MNEFLQKLDESYGELEDIVELTEEESEQYLDDLLEDYGYDLDTIVEALELDLDGEIEDIEVYEALKKRVDSKGRVTRVKDRKTRKRRAGATTGMSKTKRKMRARKASKTRKRSPGSVRKAVKKRRKSLRKRKQMGIK